MAARIWSPPGRIANDVTSVTVAGHTFAGADSVGGAAGGIVVLRVGLLAGGLRGLAQALARIDGVRVTSGPAIASQGDCYLVHCPGFKLVLSAPEPGNGTAQALLSRTVDPGTGPGCELASVFARLMAAPPVRAESPSRAAPPRQPLVGTSTLRRVALQPGKTLARKAPLQRKKPLGRGRWPRS
jgi:hypothetical protein